MTPKASKNAKAAPAPAPEAPALEVVPAAPEVGTGAMIAAVASSNANRYAIGVAIDGIGFIANVDGPTFDPADDDAKGRGAAGAGIAAAAVAFGGREYTPAQAKALEKLASSLGKCATPARATLPDGTVVAAGWVA